MILQFRYCFAVNLVAFNGLLVIYYWKINRQRNV